MSSYFNLGGGMGLTLTRSTELSAVWIATVSGKNGAHVARMLAVGTTWSFGGGFGGFGGGNSVSKQRNRETADGRLAKTTKTRTTTSPRLVA